jgi:hypothetical protein
MTDSDDQAIRAAIRLEGAVQGLRQEIGALRTYGARNRHLILGLAISLLLDVILSIVVAFVAVSASDASSLANQNKQTQLATCRAGNETRAANVQLWTYVLDLAAASNPAPPTPQRTESLKQFTAYLHTVYAPRDCDAGGSASPLPPPPSVPTR